jgi:ATP-binding cassette subfamily B protein
LLVYWALNLPLIGQEMAQLARQYPLVRNITLRLLEPLGAPENTETVATHEQKRTAAVTADTGKQTGVHIHLNNVAVRAGGHTILQDVNVEIGSNTHVAIVGASGAGKSTLVGLLLGWHRAAAGTLFVDGRPLDAHHLAELRRTTAWVDPGVQLWNRSLLDNLRYGEESGDMRTMVQVIDAADLRTVLEKLPEGMQAVLGEHGGLVSGGEGQRVRLGRAMLRQGVRLVILDEPFRGLDRSKRQASLLCITHDIAETMAFDRVLVVHSGRIVEDDQPAILAAERTSYYRTLLDAEDRVHKQLWQDECWHKLYLADGKIQRKVEVT